MNKNTEKDIGKLFEKAQDNFIKIKKCDILYKKMNLIQQNYKILKETQNIVNEMNYGAKKDRYQNLLDNAKKEIKVLAKQTQNQMKLAKRVNDIALSMRKQATIIGQDMLNQPEYNYNPRMTINQNLVRKMIVVEANNNQTKLKNDDLQKIAAQFQASNDVMSGIDTIVKQQFKKKLKPKTQLKNTDITEQQQNNSQQNSIGNLQQNKVVLDSAQKSVMNAFKTRLSSKFAQFGYSIKSFFKNIFSSKKNLEKNNISRDS